MDNIHPRIVRIISDFHYGNFVPKDFLPIPPSILIALPTRTSFHSHYSSYAHLFPFSLLFLRTPLSILIALSTHTSFDSHCYCSPLVLIVTINQCCSPPLQISPL